MKSICTGFATLVLALGVTVAAQASFDSGFERDGGINLPQQSAPGCERNPPPSQC